MNFDDLINPREPPPNRVGHVDGTHEFHFYEGAVMLAFAMHLFRTENTTEVHIHPDGLHGQQFDFRQWLEQREFKLENRTGRTSYGGRYVAQDGRRVVIVPKSGLGDVVAEVGRRKILVAECKGGIINTRHPGQVSRLDRGLCETVGRLMASHSRGRQVAVVPYTEQTVRLAQRLTPRCRDAGIEIALIKSTGEVADMTGRDHQ